MEIFHNVKKDKDGYAEAKRTTAEKAILHEIKRCNAFQNIQLRKTLKMEKRMSNIEKMFESLHKTIGLDSFTRYILDAKLDPIPEDEEAERLAEIEIEEEIINIDKRDPSPIENEDELVKTLYGDVNVPNPDESLIITEEHDLTPSQSAAKARQEQIAEEVAKTKHQYDVHDGAWSYEKYLNLVQHVAEDRVTEIGAPTSQENFVKRYNKPWDPKMTLLVDFDVPRSKTRHSKPRDWEERVAKENELALKIANKRVVNIKTEPEDETKNDEGASTSKLKVKKSKRVFKDENVNEEADSLFDSDDDFQMEEPKPKNKKRKSAGSPSKAPPLKKSKTSAKAKAKNSSISRQIVK